MIAKGKITDPPIKNRQAVMAKGEIPSPKSFPASSIEDHMHIAIRLYRLLLMFKVYFIKTIFLVEL